MVGLTWSAASGAIGYYVKRATVSGGPYTTLGTTSGTCYSDTTGDQWHDLLLCGVRHQ